jgi:UDP-N-acetylglucosamine acyltransferase
MRDIHPTAIVDKNAQLGENVKVGPFSIIENNVIIGKDCTIASNVLIAPGTRLGENCKIHNGAVLGTNPQDLKFEDEETFLQIGNNTTIREFATLNRGTTHSIYTRVGDNCLIMAYAHIAHDCQIGNNVIMANSVNLAGHVIIEDFVGIGGVTPIHQFVRIGEQSFIGGGYRVPKDVPPYMLAMGEPLRFAGLNKTGLIRRGFSAKTLSDLRHAYKILYRENNTKEEAIKIMSEKYPDIPEVMHLVGFLKNSERGIIR